MNLFPVKNGNNLHVIHTRPRHEKKLFDKCVRIGLTTYLPLMRKKITNRGRLCKIIQPLFPGYLFSCFSRYDRKELYRTRIVANIIDVV